MSDDTLVLGGEFAPVTYEDWMAEVEKVLKGAPFDKRMVYRTYDGLTVQPIYTRQDWSADGDPSGFPGAPPYTRGTRADGSVRGGWDIRQEAVEPDPAQANRTILTDLGRGVSSVIVRLDKAVRAGVDGDGSDLAGDDGVMVYDMADLARLFTDVRLEIAPVALEAGAQALPAAALLTALWRQRGIEASACAGTFGADPIGALAATGTLPVDLDTALAQMADLAAFCAGSLPGVRAVTVNTTAYHGAGCSEAEDLAVSMATAVTYLRALEAAGLSVDDAFGQIAFSYAVDCDFFEAIAKLRAARKLWSRIGDVSGAGEAARGMSLHVRTADRMMSRVDPWVNILRTTVAAFAGAVAGAESLTVRPYDAALGLPDALARRIARNTQVILAEESSLARVIDPAGGSWYVEKLTDQLADAAWSEFQEIEREGGIVAALGNGHVAKVIDDTWAARSKNLARRKDALTGVSEFPNIREEVAEHVAPDVPALKAALGRRLTGQRAKPEVTEALERMRTAAAGSGALTEAAVAAAAAGATTGQMAAVLAGEPTTVPALPVRRLAAIFERLRDASRAHAEAAGDPPKIFLANIGPIAHHTARAAFSKNFFEVGGIEAVSSGGFTEPDAVVAAFRDSGARIAILCSSDKLYEPHAVPFAQALKAAGCDHLFLAGNPGDKKDTYISAGIDDFIFLGSNVLETLERTLVRLGVTLP